MGAYSGTICTYVSASDNHRFEKCSSSEEIFKAKWKMPMPQYEENKKNSEVEKLFLR